MRHCLAAIEVALRVLTALTEKRDPDEADVSALQHLAALSAFAPVDELACEVIHQALKQIADLRGLKISPR
jgi:N-acetylmuramic acid 6-phosphate (MurNAc-6-P) etherase